MKTTAKTKTLTTQDIKSLVEKALDDSKAVNVNVLDVRKIASFTDYMIICSGTSNRHVKTLADQVIIKTKEAGMQPLSVEGERGSEWILVDLVDVVVHIMLPAAREFYNLEKLWQHQTSANTEE